MSSEEDDELAQMRAARAARMGTAGLSLSQLRAKQQAEEEARSRAQYVDRPAAAQGQRDDDDDEDGPAIVEGEDGEGDEPMEEPDLYEGVRAHLPLSFGKQEERVIKPDEVHSKTKRSGPAVGPPRPPGVGPVRPPAVGPSRPPAAGDGQPSTSAAGTIVGPPRPPAAGGDLVGLPRAPAAGQDEEEEAAVGPPRPPPDAGDGPGPSGVADSDEEEEDTYRLPISHEVAFSGHDRTVTAIDIDQSGSRVATGSIDNTVRLYDFGGMKSDFRAFRELTPHEGHPVHAVSWSPSGDAFLAVDGSAQAKVYDRDGHELGEFVRGDMYIRDMKNTKGHISGLTYGQWHPTDRYSVLTSSEDGTVRVWDAHNIGQKTVIKPALQRPGRVAVTTCAYNSDGRFLAAGLMDGSIQVWGVGGKFGTSAAVGAVLPPKAQMMKQQDWSYVSRPSQQCRKAHEPESEITSLLFSQDNFTLVTRSADATLKLWDLRKFSQPVAQFADLPANYPTTNCCWSPDEQLVLTGTAAGSDSTGGAVVFIDVKKQEVVRRVGMPSNVARVTWHERLNQIFVGIGDRKGGSTRVLYDPRFSERGVLAAAVRQPRKPSPFDFQAPLVIKTFGALPLFREDNASRKRQREKDRKDPTKSHKPDPGATAGVGRQGRIGATGGTLLTQHLMRQKGKLKAVADELDPREAILRHANTKGDDISMLTAAYRKTQPTPIYAEPSDEEEEEQQQEQE